MPPLSGFVFEEGEAIDVGVHGDHDYVFADGNEVADGGDSTVVYEDGSPIGSLGGPIWAADRDKLYELDPNDMSVVRSKDFAWNPHGAGGDDTVIWSHGQQDSTIRKIDPTDFTVLDSYTETSTSEPFTEIGGYANRIIAAITGSSPGGDRVFVYDSSFNKIGEFSLSTQTIGAGGDSTYSHIGTNDSTVQQTDSSLSLTGVTYTTDNEPVCCGGSASRCYVGDGPGSGANTIKVLNGETYELLRTESVSGVSDLTGLGGV